MVKLYMNKKIFQKNWIKISLFFLLVILVGLYLRNISLKYDLIYSRAIPHIELSNVQFKSDSDNYDHIYISGFVAFEDIDDQPRELRQYYIIESLLRRDSNSKQIFSLREIISLSSIPPREFDAVQLIETESSASHLILEDEVGNVFIINKFTKEVTMHDVTGDLTYLITSQSEYRDFIVDLLK